MRRSAGILFLLVLAGGLLTACGSKDIKPQDLDPNIFPANYKEEMISVLQRALIDPTNVREAFVSPPVLTQVGTDQRYTACVRYNARGYNRTYQGSKERIAYFYGGHLNQLVDAKPGQCEKAAYAPFPELEKMCLAEKCA